MPVEGQQRLGGGDEPVRTEATGDWPVRFHVREDEKTEGYAVHDDDTRRIMGSGLPYVEAHQAAGLLNRADWYTKSEEQFGRGAKYAGTRIRQLALRLIKNAVAPGVGHVTAVSRLLARLGRAKRTKAVKHEHRHHLAAARAMYQDDAARAQALPADLYRYRPEVSTAEHALWESTDAEKRPHIVGARGSATREDFLRTDLGIASGTFDKTARWARAKKDAERIMGAVGGPGANVTFTGHSLGGTIAQHLADRYDATHVGFNPGVGLQKELPKAPGVTYSVDGDAVSSVGHILAPSTHKVYLLPKKGVSFIGNHLASAFDVEDAPKQLGQAPIEKAQASAEKAQGAVDPEDRPGIPGEITIA